MVGPEELSTNWIANKMNLLKIHPGVMDEFYSSVSAPIVLHENNVI